MHRYIISADASAADMTPIGMAMHELLSRLPVTLRSKNQPGVRIEAGRVVDDRYSGPVLEAALEENRLIKETPRSGPFRGVPVVVSPIRDENGAAIAALGVVDITGIFDLATLMEHQSAILKQVCGKDPCPLPGEQVGSKR
jgi:hypothetical protein